MIEVNLCLYYYALDFRGMKQHRECSDQCKFILPVRPMINDSIWVKISNGSVRSFRVFAVDLKHNGKILCKIESNYNLGENKMLSNIEEVDND